eukprot:3484420-Amphidinium_carterae.1
MAPAPKKRPRSEGATDTGLTSGCNNLSGVTVERVGGELQAFGPRDKVDLVDPVALRLLFAGDRRGAQDHLRNSRRAIRNRYEEHLPGATASLCGSQG